MFEKIHSIFVFNFMFLLMFIIYYLVCKVTITVYCSSDTSEKYAMLRAASAALLVD